MYRVCLDAGHFGKYNASPGVRGYYESVQMWKLTQLQAAALRKRGVEVILTRSKLEVDLALTSRGKKAKGCDLLISNHSNAVGRGMNEKVDYVVAYVPLNGSANEIGKALADCIASTMGTTQQSRIATRKGSTGADYYGVIRGAVAVGVPGMILEHSFHTNTKATKWLLSDENLAILAEREAECIVAYLKAKKPAQAEFKPYMVRVSIEDLNIRKGPGVRYARTRYIPKGAYTIVKEQNGWGKLKNGEGWISLKYTTRV